MSFKSEDLDSAKITSNHISIRDYHQTAANRWEELDAKGDKVVIVLAWCFSHQWLSNTTADGNHGRLKMK